MVLRIVGWLGLALFGSNAAIKLFATDEVALHYAGPGRDLDLNITVGAFLPYISRAGLHLGRS